MATTIKASFQTFRSNLEITSLQATTVSTRQKTVRDAVAAELEVLDSFLSGSYKRSTMIAPLSSADVDIVTVMDPKYYKSDGQAGLLDKTKTALQNHYKTTLKISRNGQAVTITFNDFVVDVVPGFNRKGGGLLIPDTIKGRWISTDPKKHVDIWSDANAKHNGDLVPLIKMMKCWNREHSGLLRSFHLEAMLLELLNNVTISSFSSGARWLFDKMRAKVKQAVNDPTDYGGNLGDYLDTQQKIDEVVSRLETAYKRAVDAEDLEKQGKTAQAVEKWRLIFGDYFPAYG